MSLAILDNQNQIRLAAFVGGFLFLAILEQIFRFRTPIKNIGLHYLTNFSMIAIAYIGFKVLGVALAVEWADRAQAKSWGLLNQFSLPIWVSVPLTILLLDLIIYYQHRLFHRFDWFWYLHKLHHADTDFDVSTGIRFHPLEIALSMLIKIIAVVLLGLPALGVLVFEVILNATSLFTHTNINLPPSIDLKLRRIFVTPNMHRIHHSVKKEEMNSNFGFNFAFWDRAFGTYRKQSAENPRTMKIGLG